MKRFLIIGALALGLVAMSRQEASAWIKCRFSVGLNWSWDSGNNNFLWGFMKNGQVPGYPTDFYAGGASMPPPSPYAGMMGGGMVGGYPDMGGHAPTGGPGFVAPAPSQTQEPPTGKGNNSPAPGQPTAVNWYGNSSYQPVGYNQAPSYNQTPRYNYGSYGSQGYTGYGSSGFSQVPSYWYGY